MHDDPAAFAPDDRILSRIGVLVAAGGDGLGRALFARVVRRELHRRLPASSIRCFGLDPPPHPEGLDGGEPLEPLGPWGPGRAEELADQLDCVIVGGGDLAAPPLIGGLGADLESRCPVMWMGVGLSVDPAPEDAALVRSAFQRSPSVSVRDEASRRRLEAAGVDRKLEVIPHPGLLAARHFDREVLDKRLEYLRLMGWYPVAGQALVVQGDGAIGRLAPELAEAIAGILDRRGDLSVVVADVPSPGPFGDFASALREAMSERSYRIPPEVEVEDWIAAIVAASGFIGTSADGYAVATAFGRPAVLLDRDGRFDPVGIELTGIGSVLAEKAEAVAESFERSEATAGRGALEPLWERLGQELDRVAGIAREAGVLRGKTDHSDRPDPETETALLRTAHDALSRRLAVERAIFADVAASFRPDVDRLEKEVARLERQLQTMRSRRIFRYTTPLLSLYGTLRRWLGLQR